MRNTLLICIQNNTIKSITGNSQERLLGSWTLLVLKGEKGEDCVDDNT